MIKKSSFLRWFLLADLLLLLVGGGGQAMRARRWWSVLQSDAAALRALAAQGPQAVLPWRPDEVLALTHADLRGIRREFAFVWAIAPHLRWLPVYGADLAALPDLLQIALDLTECGEVLAVELQPLWASQETLSSPQGQTLESALALLRDIHPHLTYTAEVLARAQQTRAAIDASRLSPRLAAWVAELDAILPLLDRGVQGALILPELLGTTETRTYLLIMHNEDELRPAGGFLTGAARVTVSEGRIVQLYFENSAEVTDFKHPYPDPPTPLRDIMGLDLWVFHDSNWSPDFPTSARQAVAFYVQRYEDITIDGVLALDQQGFQYLLAALQPLVIAEYPEPITGDNAIAALRHSRDTILDPTPLESWEHRHKALLEALLQASIQKIQEQPQDVDFAKLSMALLRAFNERRLFAYALTDPNAATLLRQTKWDGRLFDGQGDYLMVADANLGYNKVNPYIAQQMDYTVDLSNPGAPQADLTLIYQHNGPQVAERCYHFRKPLSLTYAQLMEQCYWDYARVYAPGGSRLVNATLNPVPGRMLLTSKGRTGEAEIFPEESGKAVFGTFFVLPSGQRAETRFVYNLPPQVIIENEGRREYRLYIQKQGGKGAIPTTIHLRLPPGAKIVTGVPTTQTQNELRYETTLETDFLLEITFD